MRNVFKLIFILEYLLTVESLVNFLVGECKLETFLEDNPPIEQNANKARTSLAEAKRCLLSSLNDHTGRVCNYNNFNMRNWIRS